MFFKRKEAESMELLHLRALVKGHEETTARIQSMMMKERAAHSMTAEKLRKTEAELAKYKESRARSNANLARHNQKRRLAAIAKRIGA